MWQHQCYDAHQQWACSKQTAEKRAKSGEPISSSSTLPLLVSLSLSLSHLVCFLYADVDEGVVHEIFYPEKAATVPASVCIQIIGMAKKLLVAEVTTILESNVHTYILRLPGSFATSCSKGI